MSKERTDSPHSYPVKRPTVLLGWTSIEITFRYIYIGRAEHGLGNSGGKVDLISLTKWHHFLWS